MTSFSGVEPVAHKAKYTPHDLSLQRSTAATPQKHAAAEKVGPIASPRRHQKKAGGCSQRDLSFPHICSLSFVCLSAGFFFFIIIIPPSKNMTSAPHPPHPGTRACEAPGRGRACAHLTQPRCEFIGCVHRLAIGPRRR